MMPIIPIRFRKEIQLHLLNNYSIGFKETTPLILGIDGHPGDGKTFQCNEILKELNCNVVSLSASDFGSKYESIASNYIIQKYREAASMPMPVLLLNDIDTAIGNWGELAQFTSNRQFVLNELMHLCDCPENPHDIPSKRVPIIMTGNDFKKMYAPLVRFGRMKHFEWAPFYEEKLDIISDILYPLSPITCKKILDDCESFYLKTTKKEQSSNVSLPISFYSQLRTEITNKRLSEHLDFFGWHQTRSEMENMNINLYEKIITDGLYDDTTILDIAKDSIEKYIINSFV